MIHRTTSDPRPMLPRRRPAALCALAAAATAAVALVAAPVSPAHADAPAVTITSEIDPSLPQEVPAAASDPDNSEAVHLTLTADQTTSVSLTASGAGLAVDEPTQTVSVRPGGTGVSIGVEGTAPGLHALTVTATAPGGSPTSLTLPNIYVDGSSVVTRGGDLTGRTYGWEGTDTLSESDSRAVRTLSFVSPTLATTRLPAHGRPTCARVSKQCRPYAYDPASGLVEVDGVNGHSIIAKVLGKGLFTDGLIPADTGDGELYAAYTFADDLVFPKAGTRLAGSWAYRSRDYPSGLVFERLHLRRDRTYVLSYRYANGKTRVVRGSYRITGHGAIAFGSHGHVAVRGTLAPVAQRRYARHGVWLILAGRHGGADGNLLRPTR